ncbi:5-oxoprolinase [Kordiimonas sediminis]|uniref:5-oxoprolinase n=1 Tax=Kordiimonas sediminis TaxID=1735581 RepID=A0A919AKW6_9PROT|nr:hydantoinase/oxoprolinase family protein [Kordiimonas sediminis]GHF13570.1 5-oxoprolinase [Kordiimonas sediminis]
MRVASDVGGTFTDLVYCDFDAETGKAGEIKIAKAHTTPPNFEDGVLNAVEKAGINPAEIDFFAHGSTVVINALTERKGVKTGLLTTAGFRDVLEIARGNRPDLFNLAFQKPAPFVERHLRREVQERTCYQGQVETPADLSGLAATLDYFKKEGVEAIAICFLHAYLNPANEQAVADEIKNLWPDVSVIASHEISREWREYERTNTTVLSAYVHPIAETYIQRLENKLADKGFGGSLYMMQSNGGISTASAAKKNPITMVESGPASGIHAAACLGEITGHKNLIVLDIGGTTAKCTLIEDGHVRVSTNYYIEKDHKSPGYPIQTPVSEIVEIGNGGGSIAWLDAGGKMHVGPHSAGARPGPAAYGQGGDKPTTTDANLVLGRIDPKSFVGGDLEPDWTALENAFAPLCEGLGASQEEVARGVIRIANANMVNALRLVSVNKGYDPRDFALIAFGGGGAMHAVALADELNIPHVIVPVNSSVFSAWGMLMTDLRRDYIRTAPMAFDDDHAALIADRFSALMQEATSEFAEDEADGTSLIFTPYVDARYVGQEHTVKIPVAYTADGSVDTLRSLAAFHETYEREFTYRLDLSVEIVNLHLVASKPVAKANPVARPVTGAKIEDVILHTRSVDFDEHGLHEATIYDGLRLETGMELSGPAVIQEPSVTLVVPPAHTACVDAYGNYHIHAEPAGKGE